MSDDKVSESTFYKAVNEVKEQINSVTLELAKTQTLIRDYNGLREKINEFEAKMQGNKSSREWIGWGVAVVLGVLQIVQFIN